MTESENCINFIKQKENMPLYLNKGMSVPRFDILCNKWDIGYGTRYYPNGIAVAKKDGAITEEKATEYLKYYVDICCNKANTAIICCLNQSQFDALISFAYNEGANAFAESTLLKTINNNPYDLINIRTQFLRWKFANGKPDNGLLNRRKEEFELYISELDLNTPYYKEYLNYIGKTNY